MQRLAIALLAAGGLMTACAPVPHTASGEMLYKEFCASCHGASGRGDGPGAASIGKIPADLTRINVRNGGSFPTAYVISTIDGYTRAEDGDLAMPEFGVMMEDQPMVLVDTGDGIVTPVPRPLYALAEYLRTIQRP